MASTLGTKIRDLRKKKEWTLDKLAAEAGLSKSYLWELENREDPKRPSADTIKAIGDALGVTSEYLMEEDVRPPKEREKDEAFFRQYRKLDQADKEKLRQIIEAFKKS
jgi:transcriptional regulator with XRE-family HTH domain